MADNYFTKVFRKNWKFIIAGIIIIIIIGFVFKNVGEMPYENQHLMSSRLTVDFNHQGTQIRGFLYVSYWVETEPEVTALPTSQLRDYLYKHGRLDLDHLREKLIAELKTYSLEEIMNQWYSDYQYFKSRDIYFIKNDSRLEKFLKRQNLKLDLPFQIKKVFFVYLDEETFSDYKKNVD